MKKLLLSVFSVLALSVGVQAQTWNFTDFTETTNKESITEIKEINGLTIGGGKEKAISFDTANAVELDGESFTGRLKFGGTGTIADKENALYLPSERYVSFPVTGDATITIIGASSNANERVLNITDGTKLLSTLTAITIAKQVVNYTGDAGTIYIYSANSGFNLYKIVVESGGNSINDVTADKGAVVATEYYNVTGVKVTENTVGLLLKKLTYENGTTEVVKTIVR